MGIVSGLLSYIDFEDYSLGGILGQGTPPYVWSEHDTLGGPLDAADAFNIVDSDGWGGGSGLIANKYTTDTGGALDRLSFLVLQSGLPSNHDALTYRWSMSINEADAHQFENALLLRPSGFVFENGGANDLRCVRVEWYHIGTETNYRLTVKSKLSTTTLFFNDYFIERSRNINNIEFLVEDTGSNIKVYANASGTFELTHDIDTEDFNYHEPSGAFLVRNNAGLCNTSLNDISFGYYDTEILYSSGYIGGYVPSAVAISIYADDALMAGVWRFDETGDDDVRVDSSPTGSDLDIITGSPVQVDGRRDKAIQFKHWDEPYPSVARTSSGCFSDIDIESSDWTMGGWIKPSGGAYELYAYVAGKGNYDQYTLYLDEEMEICTQLHFDGIRYMLNGGRVSGLTPNVWNHIDWVVDKGIGYQALYLTPNDGICEPVLLDRSPIPSGFGEQEGGFGPFIFGASPIGREPFDGQLDEWYLRAEPLRAIDIQSICLFGLPNQYVIDASGHIGGYMPGAVPLASPSGYIGGYIYHMLVEPSGYLGGYLYQTTVPSSASGYVGGYTLVSSYPSGYVGTYMVAHETASGYLGGYLFGRHDASGAWLAYFDILSTQFLDFDAQTHIGSAENAEFDATCTIERVISPPTVTCAIDGSSSVSGYAVTFSGVATVADITLLDGRSNQIESAFIKWGDFSTQMVNVNSIGQWQTTHIYPTSGVYMPRIDVVDSNGAHGSCHKKVDLSVGASDIIQLDLTAAPSSGAPPLAVAFTNTYVAQPAGEIESVIDFGDRTLTHLDNPVHLYRYAGHYIAIWIVKDDRGRFWNDSTDVGVNT